MGRAMDSIPRLCAPFLKTLAVVRCSGARVFRTPSHVKESFTAAIVVRSLLAALGEVCVAGLVAGEVVVRLVVCWLVSWDVVVVVDMNEMVPVFGL